MADKEEAVNKSPNRTKIILIVCGALALLFLMGGMMLSMFFILKSNNEIKVTVEETVPVDPKNQAKSEKSSHETAKAEGEKPASDEEKKDEPKKEAAKHGEEVSKEGEKPLFGQGKPQFYKFKPTFVVTIPDMDKIRYLQLDIEIMSRSSSTIEGVESLAPLIRNDLINLISSQDYDEVITPEGKERLRAKALQIVQTILTANLGKAEVEQVLFTNFVTQ